MSQEALAVLKGARGAKASGLALLVARRDPAPKEKN